MGDCKDRQFSITKHYSIEIFLSSIAQSSGQYFPVLPSCLSNMENQLFQYEAVSDRVTERVLCEDKNHSPGLEMSYP